MMIHNPEIQEKVQLELDAVAHGRTILQMADKVTCTLGRDNFSFIWKIDCGLHFPKIGFKKEN